MILKFLVISVTLEFAFKFTFKSSGIGTVGNVNISYVGINMGQCLDQI